MNQHDLEELRDMYVKGETERTTKIGLENVENVQICLSACFLFRLSFSVRIRFGCLSVQKLWTVDTVL